MPTSQIQLLLTLRAIILECEWGMERHLGLWATHWGCDGEAGLWGWKRDAGESVVLCRAGEQGTSLPQSNAEVETKRLYWFEKAVLWSWCCQPGSSWSALLQAGLWRHTPTLGGSEPSTLYAGGESQGIETRWDVFIWQDEKERETMRREEGSLFSDECNIKEARWKSLKGRGPDPMEMGWGRLLFKGGLWRLREKGPTSFTMDGSIPKQF